jgi:hypothetical protein
MYGRRKRQVMSMAVTMSERLRELTFSFLYIKTIFFPLYKIYSNKLKRDLKYKDKIVVLKVIILI